MHDIGGRSSSDCCAHFTGHLRRRSWRLALTKYIPTETKARYLPNRRDAEGYFPIKYLTGMPSRDQMS